MQTATSNNYLTHTAWFDDVLKEHDVILCYTSALEYLGLFTGYINEKSIDVYSKGKGIYENICYHLVDDFDGIDFVRFGNILCTSVNQTFNDMMSKYGTAEEDTIDEQSLIEGLSNYYFLNNKSFDGLYINSENRERFEILREWALDYHNY